MSGNESLMERAFLAYEQRALRSTSSQERPVAILLGGQPGSGKSTLAYGARDDLAKKGGAILIDADRLRVLNPAYKRLSLEDPVHAADRTQKEAAELVTRLLHSSVRNRRHLVLDGTMRNPASVLELGQRLASAGYEVQIRVMAVNPEISISRARLRFEKQVQDHGSGRYVNQEQHDQACEGLVESVRAIERADFAREIRVYDAQHREILQKRRVQGQWNRRESAADVLCGERKRPLSSEEKTGVYRTLQETVHALEMREKALADALKTGDTERARILGLMPRDLEAQKARLLAVKKGFGLAGTPATADAPEANAGDAAREAEAQRLVEAAVAQKREQQAMVEASPLEKTWQESLASYVQLKHDQVARLEDRLETLLAARQRDLKRSIERKPGVFALPRTRRAWQAAQVQQKARIQTLVNRLGVVRDIRSGMGVFAPRIEELATRKMRAAHPEMASDWDAMREAFRAGQIRTRLQMKSERQTQSASKANVQRARLTIGRTK